MRLTKRSPNPQDEPSKIRVLIAEDDELVRDALSAIIGSDACFEVVAVTADADSAIAQVISAAPDLALLDVRMPGGGGERVAQVIAETRPTVRIIAVSAHEDEQTIRGMIAAGAHGFVTKDAGPTKLLDTLMRVASGESVFTPTSSVSVMREYARSNQQIEAQRRERKRRELRIEQVCEPGQMKSVFQPIVDLKTGEVEMYEALTRFNPVHGLNPQQWFEEAADLGMGGILEAAALERTAEAIEQAGRDDIVVSLNVSPSMLIAGGLDGHLEAFPPERTVIEITEHARITDYDEVKAVAEQLHHGGARLAIDDAGAGFASLRHILDLAPDLIKLDISLVRSIDTDAARHALATGLTAFAKEIGAQIVAEGIETREEFDTLCELGVDYGQGYFLARPAPLEELSSIEIAV